MKKTNIFKIIFGVIPACFLGNIVTAHLNNVFAKNNNQIISSIKTTSNEQNIKKIDAKLIGAQKGTVDVKFIGHQCTIVKANNDFLATGNFNFNNGKFMYEGVEYTITEIGDEVFATEGFGNRYFKNCNLTIPSTIKKIGDYAFAGNTHTWSFCSDEIININFDEGIEDIGENAFCVLNDIKWKKIILPNSLQHIGNGAFSCCHYLGEIDLSALDHVIQIDTDPFDKDGFLCSTPIQKIWFKNQTIRQAYSIAKFWCLNTIHFVTKGEIFKTISSNYIGGNSNSTFRFSYLNSDSVKISGVSNNFVADKNFNFNGGKFTYEGIEYTITEIEAETFIAMADRWYFKNCNLTIPASIKKIGDRAFYGNSRNTFLSSKEIVGLNFEEGIEDIGKKAFKKCDDLESDKLVLPNSLQHIGNNAFEGVSPLKELDLSALDHVIRIDAIPFDKDGCLYGTNINKIWVKDQTMKDKYCNDPYWSFAAKYFVLKGHVFKTINSTYIGGSDDSTFDFNYYDPKQTKITSVSSKFVANKNFNFNNGKFTYDNDVYTISEIGDNAFNPGSTHWFFKNCNLTIPSTVKRIRNKAFYGNSRNWSLSDKEIISIKFNEGLENIGMEAFKKCDDLTDTTIKLPNSLKHIGDNAFSETNLEILDLTALDHVINLDANSLDKKGFLCDTKIKTIWVKDQTIKDKYCANQYWSSVSQKIKIK